MDNKAIAHSFKRYSQLMELHGENAFKTKAMANAAYKLDKLPFTIADKTPEELSQIDGIGKSTALKIGELLLHGTFPELEKLKAATPEGILEMLNIKGIGPKKIATIWQTLGIESIGELYYACNENRLIEAKGFGLKTQEEVRKMLEFTMDNTGKVLYARAEQTANETFTYLEQAMAGTNYLLSPTGAYRRCSEVIDAVELLISAPASLICEALRQTGYFEDPEISDDMIHAKHTNGIRFTIYSSTPETFFARLIETTGNPSHVTGLCALLGGSIPPLASEAAIYQQAGLAFIPPELREGLDELALAGTDQLPTLVTYDDIKGSLHNHSTYSDGVHTLKDMALFCKNELKLQYLGICDHSKTAVYASGLSMETVHQQWHEIDLLNQQLAPFRIFKGIESDILSNGDLDYPDDILAGFDFVVASIHSNLKMDEAKATSRLIKAIENPYTTILGHPTGRLLLSRKGYPIDYQKVIDACAANGVVIEINANPLRLDLDWRWHRYALSKGVIMSVNPDAHRTEGFYDMHYGIKTARKGGVPAVSCLNCYDLETIGKFFRQRKTIR